MGTVNVSDTIQSPWSWEFTAGENSAYSHTQESCYQIGGTRASLAIPQLDLWHHPSKASWWAPIERERLSYENEDPLALQIANFCGVIRGTAEPVVSGREGLKTLTVIDVVKRAAETGDGTSASFSEPDDHQPKSCGCCLTTACGPKAKIGMVSRTSAVEARPDIAETRVNRRECPDSGRKRQSH
ncbi:hypothetical protein ABIA00_006616 [Bradyrhizobium ottawaense]|nr:hypothetical protein TM102_60930 [Bradyrhizobium sp. TM102]